MGTNIFESFTLKLSLGLLLTVVAHVIVAQTVSPTANSTMNSSENASNDESNHTHHHHHHSGNDSDNEVPHGAFNFCGIQQTGAAHVAKDNAKTYHHALHDCRKQPLCPEPECLSTSCRHQCSVERNHGVITESKQFDSKKFHELFTENLDNFDKKQKLIDDIDACGANKTFTTTDNCKVFAEFFLCVRHSFQEECGNNTTATQAGKD